MNKQNKRFNDKIQKDLDRNIAYRRENIEEIQRTRLNLENTLKALQEEIKSIENTKKRLPNQIEVIEEEIKHLKSNGYARLDGRVGKAIEHRKLATVMDMKQRPTSLEVYNTYSKYKDQYWCKEWFVTVVKAIPTPKRQQFYETLAELKDDPEELEKQVGLWLMQAL